MSETHTKYPPLPVLLRCYEKIVYLRISDQAEDLLPLFEQRSFIEAWLEGFKDNFGDDKKNYLQEMHFFKLHLQLSR